MSHAQHFLGANAWVATVRASSPGAKSAALPSKDGEASEASGGGDGSPVIGTGPRPVPSLDEPIAVAHSAEQLPATHPLSGSVHAVTAPDDAEAAPAQDGVTGGAPSADAAANEAAAAPQDVSIDMPPASAMLEPEEAAAAEAPARGGKPPRHPGAPAGAAMTPAMDAGVTMSTQKADQVVFSPATSCRFVPMQSGQAVADSPNDDFAALGVLDSSTGFVMLPLAPNSGIAAFASTLSRTGLFPKKA